MSFFKHISAKHLKKCRRSNITYRLIFECARCGNSSRSRYYTSCRKRGFLALERRPVGHGSWVHLQDWCERQIFDYHVAC